MSNATQHQTNKLIDTTERDIASLLSGLEKLTGRIVDVISIETIWTTTISSTAPEHLRRVVISLKPKAGAKWQT